jgi:hypothetical protein
MKINVPVVYLVYSTVRGLLYLLISKPQSDMVMLDDTIDKCSEIVTALLFSN